MPVLEWFFGLEDLCGVSRSEFFRRWFDVPREGWGHLQKWTPVGWAVRPLWGGALVLIPVCPHMPSAYPHLPQITVTLGRGQPPTHTPLAKTRKHDPTPHPLARRFLL